MTLVLWAAGAVAVLVFFGTWAIQIAAVALLLALRLAAVAMQGVGMVIGVLILAATDRSALSRIWREAAVRADNAALLARERRG